MSHFIQYSSKNLKNLTLILLFACILLTTACGPRNAPGDPPPDLPSTATAISNTTENTTVVNTPTPATDTNNQSDNIPTMTPNAIDETPQTATNPDCAANFFINVQQNPGSDSPFTPELSARCDGTMVTVTSNSIPNHATGPFPNQGNPNAISPQRETFQLPQRPTTTGSATYYNNAAFGVAINGVEFDPVAAEYWNNDRNSGWNYDALPANLGFDFNNAHVQPTGAYHYHSLPVGLIDFLGKGQAITLVGFAADGFPIYARYGYSDPNNTNSGITEVQPSWQLKSGTRPNGPGGAYDGSFVEDWVYIAGSGDLDECNGRFGITPEYPAGIYHYYLTEQFPNIPRCHLGTADRSFIIGPGGGGGFPPDGGPSVGGQPPDLAKVAQILGISEQDLRDALGPPPPDFEAAAQKLGISVETLRSAMQEAQNR